MHHQYPWCEWLSVHDCARTLVRHIAQQNLVASNNHLTLLVNFAASWHLLVRRNLANNGIKTAHGVAFLQTAPGALKLLYGHVNLLQYYAVYTRCAAVCSASILRPFLSRLVAEAWTEATWTCNYAHTPGSGPARGRDGVAGYWVGLLTQQRGVRRVALKQFFGLCCRIRALALASTFDALVCVLAETLQRMT